MSNLILLLNWCTIRSWVIGAILLSNIDVIRIHDTLFLVLDEPLELIHALFQHVIHVLQLTTIDANVFFIQCLITLLLRLILTILQKLSFLVLNNLIKSKGGARLAIHSFFDFGNVASLSLILS